MRIWVDADSCPVRIREIIARASDRRSIETYFVANRTIPVPRESTVQMVVVPAEEGKADLFILHNAGNEDLVITRDIPLAADLVEQGITVLNDRGTVYTRENIRERLSIRNVMQDFRERGIMAERTASFSKKEVYQFSNAFDKLLNVLLKKNLR